MKKKFLLCSAIFLHTCIFAQEPFNDHYCGTNYSGITPYHLAANAKTDLEKSGTTLYIPITANFIGEDDGTGYHPLANFLDDLCKLNTDFEDYGFHFYLENANYINNSEFYEMDPDTFLFEEPMYQFIENHNIPNTLNTYVIKEANDWSFVATAPPFEDLDYSVYPPVWIIQESHALILDKDHLNNSDHLFTHEVGHYFGLWHTFEGGYWETFLQTGTPDTTYYTIDDTDNDTTYVYPWLVERVDGDSCHISGDLICDTPPDYLNFWFLCNADMESDVVQIDPVGATFRSDGTYYMSVSNIDCQDKFSPMQVDVMRNVAEGPRAYLLYDQTPPGILSADDLSLIYPLDGAAVSPVNDSITLEWDMPGADYFLLTYGVKPVPNIFFPYGSNILVTDNQYQINITNFDFEHYWIVRGVSNYYPCEVWADTSYFNAVLVGTEEIPQRETLKLYPNPANDLLFMDFQTPTSTPVPLEATILDAQGRLIGRMPVVDKNVNISALPAGIYFLKLTDGERVYAGKFVKQ